MTMTEIRGRLKLEVRDKELENAVQSQLAYRVPHEIRVDDDVIECPICGHEFGNLDDVSAYCPDCGQELDKENGYGK